MSKTADAHIINDLELVRTAGLRRAQTLSPMLSQAIHAVESGKTDTAMELLHRIMGTADAVVVNLTRTTR